MKSSRGFTLIELLIVIAIIGILMALLFPAVQNALDAAKKAQAKNDVTQLATAVTAYEAEYGRLPRTNENGQVDRDLMTALMGQTNSATVPNPRAITFFEAKNAKGGKGGYDTNSGNFVDPWGGQYYISFDGDYDNEVKGGTNNQSFRKKVVIWNNPSQDQPKATSGQKKLRYVNSAE